MIDQNVLAKALEVLDQEPPDEALNRTRKGGSAAVYLKVGDVKKVMKDAFGLSYSSTAQTTHLDVYDDPKVNKRTGEVEQEGWGAYAVAHCRVSLGAPGNPVCVREDSGTCEAQSQKSRGAAVAQAVKGAQSDAFKRAVYSLGRRLGLGLRLDPRVEYERVDGDDPRLAPDPVEGAERAIGSEQDARDAVRETAEAMEVTLGYLEACRALDLSEAVITDLNDWPAGDPLTRDLLVELHVAVMDVIGDEKTTRLWTELGVELKRGAQVSGETAGQFVLRAGSLARQSRHGSARRSA